MPYRFTLLVLVTIAMVHSTFAQDILKYEEEKDSKRDTKTYTVTSIEGESRKVQVKPDYGNHTLSINCLKSTVNIDGYWGVPPEVNILSKNFIAIKYAVRGGSNLGLGNILILCISNEKIYQSLFVLEYTDSETGDEKSAYKVSIVPKLDNKNDFQLYTNVTDYRRSTSNPETNYNYIDKTVLHFDNKSKIFYSIKKDIYDKFKISGKKREQLRGYFPVVILGTENYYFIKGSWCQIDLGKNINRFE